MEKTLNISNGDSAINLMREGGVEGALLPWRDVLHEGPVPADLDLHALSKVRADFIVSRGWGDEQAVRRGFANRDRMLEKADEFDLVRLWFEHDLYDQLQLIQLLSWWFEHRPKSTRLELICTDNYLGLQTPESIVELMAFSETVTPAQLAIGSAAWQVFRYETPQEFANLPRVDTSALPFLKGAVVRMVEEYPDRETGLSKTEYRALSFLSEGAASAASLFARNQEAEERMYLGDWSFLHMLNEMLNVPRPLIERSQGQGMLAVKDFQQELRLTPLGERVLSGSASRIEFGLPPRWIGGVHVTLENWWNGKWFPENLLGSSYNTTHC